MTAKRFKSNCKLSLVNGEEPLCKCLLDNGKHKSYREWVDLLNNLTDENEQLKQRINSRLHFYRGLYESTNDKVVERVIEDLEDILKR